MKNKVKLIAGCATLGVSLSTGVAVADVNPFEMSRLDSGYAVSMSSTPEESKEMPAEAKCGADKAKQEAKCGAEKAKTEAKCGAK